MKSAETRHSAADVLLRHSLITEHGAADLRETKYVNPTLSPAKVATRLLDLERDRDTARALAAERGEQLVRLRYERDDIARERDEARAVVERLRALVEGFAAAVEDAEADAQHHDAGRPGMCVPFHGDFAGLHRVPSMRARLGWWAREFRAALTRGE